MFGYVGMSREDGLELVRKGIIAREEVPFTFHRGDEQCWNGYAGRLKASLVNSIVKLWCRSV